MEKLSFLAENESDTDRLGKGLAPLLKPGSVVALLGTLGAGKTRLVQSLAGACGIDSQDVVSPTFILCQEYHGHRHLVHLDAYRIADDDEFLQLGVDEHFEGDSIVLIEWAERVATCLPPSWLEIDIEVTGETQRTFCFRSHGDGLEPVIDELSHRLS